MAAVDVKYLRFTKATSAGTQTVTGVGFRGKALILWTSYQTSEGDTTSAELCLGMTDGDLQSSRYIFHPGGEASTTSAQAEHTDQILWRSNATSGADPTPSVQGEFTGFTGDGFTINFTTNDANATIIHALVIGGAGVDASFEQVKITVGSGGTIAVTGVGFEPTAFIVMGGAADEFGAGDYNRGAPFGSIHGFGFSNASDNVCGWTLGRGTAGAADCYRGQHTNRVASVRVANLSGAAALMECRITATGSDGFTITRDTGTTGNQPVEHILCLSGVRFALGSFDTPGSTGPDTLELPFEPSALIFQTLGRSASTLADHMGMAIGIWTPDDSGGSWIGGTDAANPSVYRKAHFEDLILESRQASDGSVDLEVSVTGVTENGADLDYDTVPASANQIIYMAIGPIAGRRNLLTGRQHTVTGGDDNVVAGRYGTVVGNRNVVLSLDDDPHTFTGNGTLVVYGDVEIHGTLSEFGSGGSPGGSPGVGIVLDDLDDVTVPSPSDGDVLTWDSGAGEWVAAAPSGSGGGLVLLEQHTASASATLDFTSWYSASYDVYVIEFIGIRPATDNVALWMRMSTNGGSSYASGAADYAWAFNQSTIGFTSGLGDNSDSEIELVNGIDTTFTANVVDGTVKLYHPASTSVDIQITGQITTWKNDSNFYANNCAGMYRNSNIPAAVNAFRVLMSSGNIASGTIRVYGIPTS